MPRKASAPFLNAIAAISIRLVANNLAPARNCLSIPSFVPFFRFDEKCAAARDGHTGWREYMGGIMWRVCAASVAHPFLFPRRIYGLRFCDGGGGELNTCSSRNGQSVGRSKAPDV